MSATPPTTQGGTASFTTARACKEWLNGLPLTHPAQAQTILLDGLRAFGVAEIEPLERLKSLELMRDKIAFLQGEQRSRYFGRGLPLLAADAAAWSTGRALLEEMEQAYRRVAALAGEGVLAPHAALIGQRVVRYIGAQMGFHAAVYRRFDPELWARLHAEFDAARAEGIADDPVKDSLESEDGLSSIHESYVQVVLLQAAEPEEMTAAQMLLVEALLRMWVRKARVRSTATGLTGPAAPYETLDFDALSKSLRKRIHGLQKGEDPVTLGLPAEAGSLDALVQLQRLHRLWCEPRPASPPGAKPAEQRAGLAFGPAEIHFFLSGGKVFEQPDKERELSRQEKDDLAVFGRITERTQSMMLSDHRFGVEAWEVVEEALGAWKLRRPAGASKPVAIGKLLGLRLGDTGPMHLGTISGLAQETDGRIVASVRLFPGKPEPIAVRAADARIRTNAQWTQGFRLPAIEKLDIAASLVVPGGMAARGRGVHTWEGGLRESTVYEILDRGADFDRITVF